VPGPWSGLWIVLLPTFHLRLRLLGEGVRLRQVASQHMRLSSLDEGAHGLFQKKRMAPGVRN
jgi:hypothetical protein